jgi:hypothetical protein
MDPQELVTLDGRRVAAIKQLEFLGLEGLRHRPQAVDPFGMARSGIVFETRGVGKQGSRHSGTWPSITSTSTTV